MVIAVLGAMVVPRLCSVGFVDSGKGYGSLAERPEVSGTSMDVLQNSQKFRVLWHGAYRAYRSSGYGYECPTELTEVPGTGVRVLQNFQKLQVLWHGRTELTEVPGG